MQIYKLLIVTYIYFYSNVILLNIYLRERRIVRARERDRRAPPEAARRLRPPERARARFWVRDRRWLRLDIFIYNEKKIKFLKGLI
jgi:hypothetical protein